MEAAYLKVYGRRDALRRFRETLRIRMSPFPVVLASVAFRRIHQKTGITEDVHAHDHVVSHVLSIRNRHRDLEFPPSDHDARIDDVAFFWLMGRGGPNADSVEHRSQTRARRQVRVEVGPVRAGCYPR